MTARRRFRRTGSRTAARGGRGGCGTAGSVGADSRPSARSRGRVAPLKRDAAAALVREAHDRGRHAQARRPRAVRCRVGQGNRVLRAHLPGGAAGAAHGRDTDTRGKRWRPPPRRPGVSWRRRRGRGRAAKGAVGGTCGTPTRRRAHPACPGRPAWRVRHDGRTRRERAWCGRPVASGCAPTPCSAAPGTCCACTTSSGAAEVRPAALEAPAPPPSAPPVLPGEGRHHPGGRGGHLARRHGDPGDAAPLPGPAWQSG